MADAFITTWRRQLVTLMRDDGTLPVFGFLPDDVAHLPCYVVGRPTISESATPAVMTLSADVMLLGRRIADEDAQAELDGYADECFNVLGGTRGTKINGEPQVLRCTAATPGTIAVAGVEIPAYSFSVAYDILTC